MSLHSSVSGADHNLSRDAREPAREPSSRRGPPPRADSARPPAVPPSPSRRPPSPVADDYDAASVRLGPYPAPGGPVRPTSGPPPSGGPGTGCRPIPRADKPGRTAGPAQCRSRRPGSGARTASRCPRWAALRPARLPPQRCGRTGRRGSGRRRPDRRAFPGPSQDRQRHGRGLPLLRPAGLRAGGDQDVPGRHPQRLRRRQRVRPAVRVRGAALDQARAPPARRPGPLRPAAGGQAAHLPGVRAGPAGGESTVRRLLRAGPGGRRDGAAAGDPDLRRDGARHPASSRASCTAT